MAPQSLLLLACALVALYQPAVSQTTNRNPAQAYDLINMDDCKSTKSCFVHPPDCKRTQDCDAIVTWRADASQNVIHFEIGGNRATTDKWFSLGMSDDQVMGDDTVLSCTSRNGGTLLVRYSWNNPGKTNTPIAGIIQDRIIVTNSGYYNTFQACVFDVPISPGTPHANIKAIKNASGYIPYYMFLAWGDMAGTTKSPHSPVNRKMTDQKLSLGSNDFSNVSNDSGRVAFGIFSLLCLAAHLL